MSKWTAGTDTRKTGPVFKTKREATQWARDVFSGIFFVWKIKEPKAAQDRKTH